MKGWWCDVGMRARGKLVIRLQFVTLKCLELAQNHDEGRCHVRFRQGAVPSRLVSADPPIENRGISHHRPILQRVNHLAPDSRRLDG
jgi:hypothetical protein